MSIESLYYRRRCSKCKESKGIRGGYVSPKKFICADCRKPATVTT